MYRWAQGLTSLLFRIHSTQFVNVLANYLWRSEIQIEHADDEGNSDVTLVIGKKVVELSQICKFIHNIIIIICTTGAHAMSECDVTSALGGMGKILNIIP